MDLNVNVEAEVDTGDKKGVLSKAQKKKLKDKEKAAAAK